MKGVYGLLHLCLPCPFFLGLMLYDMGSLHYFPLSGHTLLLEPEALVVLPKVCQLIFYDNFNFLLRILVLIIAGFSFKLQVLIILRWLLR
jgi:hypothetical protein